MPELPYNAFERAAAGIYGGSEDTIQQFRHSIHFIQRKNLLGRFKDAKVGKGPHVYYTVDHFERWLCCLELMELGMPATVAARFVIAEWRTQLAPIFRLAHKTIPREPGEGDIVLLLPNVHVVSGNWMAGRGFPGVPEITCCTLGELPGRMAKTIKSPPAGRMLTTNLSSLLRRFHEQLAAWIEDPPRGLGFKKRAGESTAKGRSKPRARKRS